MTMSDEATAPAPQSSGLAGFVLENRSLMHPLSIIMILYAVWAVVEVFSNTYFHGLQSLTIFETGVETNVNPCLLYTSPSPRDSSKSRMPSSA